jgi:hypothetical protein
MVVRNQIIARVGCISAICQMQNLSLKGLSELASTDQKTLRRIDEGKGVKLSTLLKIAGHTKVSLSAFGQDVPYIYLRELKSTWDGIDGKTIKLSALQEGTAGWLADAFEKFPITDLQWFIDLPHLEEGTTDILSSLDELLKTALGNWRARHGNLRSIWVSASSLAEQIQRVKEEENPIAVKANFVDSSIKGLCQLGIKIHCDVLDRWVRSDSEEVYPDAADEWVQFDIEKSLFLAVSESNTLFDLSRHCNTLPGPAPYDDGTLDRYNIVWCQGLKLWDRSNDDVALKIIDSLPEHVLEKIKEQGVEEDMEAKRDEALADDFDDYRHEF